MHNQIRRPLALAARRNKLVAQTNSRGWGCAQGSRWRSRSLGDRGVCSGPRARAGGRAGCAGPGQFARRAPVTGPAWGRAKSSYGAAGGAASERIRSSRRTVVRGLLQLSCPACGTSCSWQEAGCPSLSGSECGPHCVAGADLEISVSHLAPLIIIARQQDPQLKLAS